MSDSVQFFGGILISLLMVVGTFVGTLALLATLQSTWGLLIFLTWPFVAVLIIWFVMWWDEL